MTRASFGLHSVPEPDSGADVEFDSFMRSALSTPRPAHPAPDLVAVYEAAKLGIADHYAGEIITPKSMNLADDTPEDLPDTQSMTSTDDYRHELQLRDDQLRRDMAAQKDLADERMKGFEDRMKSFMDIQAERDKRIEDIAARAAKAAESAATVKSNYWAAVGVQLLAVAAILVGAYFATQANTLSAIGTTLSAYQAGKSETATLPSSPLVPAPPSSSQKK